MSDKTENSVVENQENPVTEENKKPEWQEQLEKMMKDAYLSGLSKGGKTFIGMIYEIIIEDRKKRVNPAKTIMRVEATCKRLLGMQDYKPNNSKNNIEEDKADE